MYIWKVNISSEVSRCKLVIKSAEEQTETRESVTRLTSNITCTSDAAAVLFLATTFQSFVVARKIVAIFVIAGINISFCNINRQEM